MTHELKMVVLILDLVIMVMVTTAMAQDYQMT